MQVDAVFFDAGNTLIYPDPPVGEVYARALRRAGLKADGERVQRQFEESWRRLRAANYSGKLQYGSTAEEAQAWWRRVVRDSLEPFGRPTDFEALFRGLWAHFASASAWRIYQDVQPTLDALRLRGKGVGLISNWDVRLAPVLAELGLAGQLQWTVVSCDVGSEKPDPAIFRRALELCGLDSGRALHVGDNYEEDVLGALGAGMKAVWLRRRGTAAAPRADVPLITSLTELPRLLQ